MKKYITYILIVMLHIYAEAGISRYALFVGNSTGLPGEARLKYNLIDIRELSHTLNKYGNFDKKNILRLENKNAGEIKNAFSKFHGMIKKSKQKNNEVFALVYYTGHGSNDALHIKGGKYPKNELTQQINALGADLTVVILDACESGSFTREKGGKIIDNPAIQKIEELNQKGDIIITSSSKGESSHESEKYKNSIFSYHFNNGLLGAADYNNDNQISIIEAFNYAESATKAEFVLEGKISQNPKIDMDIVGNTNTFLTKLTAKQMNLELRDFKGGNLNIYNANNMNLEYKIVIKGNKLFHHSLPANEFLVTHEEKNNLKVAKINLARTKKAVLTPQKMREVTKGELYKKGPAVINLNPHIIELSYSQSPVKNIVAGNFYFFNYFYKTYKHIYRAHLGINYQKKSNELERIDNTSCYLGFSMAKKWRIVNNLNVAAGIRGGTYIIWQDIYNKSANYFRVKNIKENKNNISIGFVFEELLPIDVIWSVTSNFTIRTGLEAGINTYKNQYGKLKSNYSARPSIGIGLNLP